MLRDALARCNSRVMAAARGGTDRLQTAAREWSFEKTEPSNRKTLRKYRFPKVPRGGAPPQWFKTTSPQSKMIDPLKMDSPGEATVNKQTRMASK